MKGLNGWVPKSLHSLKNAARALIVLIEPNQKQGDYSQDIQRERLVPSPTGFFETCSASDLPKENSASEPGCILLWLINNKQLLVMVPLLLMIMVMSYVFSDWHIVAYTRFYACVCCVSCVCRCLVTEIVRDRDLPKLRNKSSTFSTSESIGFQVSLHH